MDSSHFDIPDPTDWLNTPLSAFSSLENALHCDICKEFYDTPMITSCCHTFCSKCIRTCLSANGKCPSCQAADQAGKLRNNWLLQTVVEQFLQARPAALEVARTQAEVAKKPAKRKRAVLDSDEATQAEQDGRTTRSKSRRIAASSQSSQPEAIEIEDSDDDDGEYAPEAVRDDGLVECLFGCGKRIKPEEMDTHLDKCEQEQQQAQRAKSRTPVHSFGSRSTPSEQTKIPDRISELNHSLLNDAKLRQKLKVAGVPDWGPRQLLIKRHTEWVNLWNANCDSGGRKTQRELLRDLDAWERTQGGKAPNVNGLSSTIMKKDFDGLGWANSNKDDFSRLIADARRKKSTSATGSVPEASEKPEMVNRMHKPMFNVPTDHVGPPSGDEVPQPASNDTGDSERNGHHYETNSEALSAVKEKGAASNDTLNTVPGNPSTLDPSVSLQASQLASQDEHAVKTTTGSPCNLPVHLHSSPTKKVPMFQMPQQPVSDVDGTGEGK